MSERRVRAESIATARCQVTVSGPLSSVATRALRAEYGEALSVERLDGVTVLDLDGVDQSAIRGLLTLLWDLGHDVEVVTNRAKERSS